MDQQRERRPDIHERMMVATVATAQGSTCRRRATGCILTLNGRVKATGYNGSLPGIPHCLDLGCLIFEGHCIRTTHAELNACLQAEIQVDTAYCTDQPCLTCLKALCTKGVKNIYFWRDYVDPARDEYVAKMRPSGIFQVNLGLSERLAALEASMTLRGGA
jgi:dCMP deaminase